MKTSTILFAVGSAATLGGLAWLAFSEPTTRPGKNPTRIPGRAPPSTWANSLDAKATQYAISAWQAAGHPGWEDEESVVGIARKVARALFPKSTETHIDSWPKDPETSLLWIQDPATSAAKKSWAQIYTIVLKVMGYSPIT